MLCCPYCTSRICYAGNLTSSATSALPHDSKLHDLMQNCFYSIHATAESRQKAVRLMSACALAHPSIYILLMPTLQRIMWAEKSPELQLPAAAGITAYCKHFAWTTCLTIASVAPVGADFASTRLEAGLCQQANACHAWLLLCCACDNARAARHAPTL